MDVNNPRFPEYKAKFEELAFLADQVGTPEPPLDQCRYYLCLYGENGLKPEEEFEFLDRMEEHIGELKKVVVETGYWIDTILYVP